MRILIVGAGIAGPTLAYWLARYGCTTRLVERAPALRTGGYVIDFWGAGFEVATRMGLGAALQRYGYPVQEVRVVDDSGRRVAGFPANVVARAVRSGFTSLPRGDLASCLFHTLPNSVEAAFGDTVARIDQSDTAVTVTFASGTEESFDLIVGADGLHSRVREIVFGPEASFERYLGIKVAAFEVAGYRPRDELVYVMYSEVGHEVARFAMRNDRTMFLFTFLDPDPTLPQSVPDQQQMIRKRFAQCGWECSQILEALDRSTQWYCDRVSQIRVRETIGSWSHGRVALVGDAAFCVSLLGGQGSALAMTAAYVLAGELHRAQGDYDAALVRYESILGPFISRKQRAARRFAGAFAPKSPIALGIRNRIFNAFSRQWIANVIARRGFSDSIALPDYPAE